MATTTSTPFSTADSPPQFAGSSTDNGSRSSSSETVSRVVQGAHEAVDRLAEKAGPAIERLAEKAGPAMDRARSSVSGMSESMRAKADQFSAIEERWVESCRTTVREHPLATVAVALAAGVLLSKLLSSSR